ncbi:uncharacterized protein CCOS01_02555 [Colletotrichum costaricense]|uniref:Uncharacterized protein n=1 Tax=Colletotrichum costaricense TaxID=1209916 RepID=A0AAJ0E7A4_9PEZI|nr:uncharacterized protein CCOS01_02555 [Colletotrichum costaricense]KAK1537235.1 hypothetical protein CCOS01_02555 [Colletotrichum costaricense]
MISFFASISFLLPLLYIFCLLLVRAQNHPIDRNMTRLIKVQHTIRRHYEDASYYVAVSESYQQTENTRWISMSWREGDLFSSNSILCLLDYHINRQTKRSRHNRLP